MTSNAATSCKLRRPSQLDEWIQLPGSKSLTNRALLLAAMARGHCRLSGLLVAEDSRRMRSLRMVTLVFDEMVLERDRVKREGNQRDNTIPDQEVRRRLTDR